MQSERERIVAAAAAVVLINNYQIMRRIKSKKKSSRWGISASNKSRLRLQKKRLQSEALDSSLDLGENETIKKEKTEESETSDLTASDPLDTRQSGVATPAHRTYAPRYSPSDFQNIMAELATASILKISDEKTLQLIDLYYNEDCLWNTNSEHYKNKEKRSLAAEKIAAILDLPNFTAKHVIIKFKNLRNSYSQELKKITHSLTSGSGHKYVPRVFWFSKMDSFIRPHLQGRPSEPSSSEMDGSILEWTQLDDADQLLDPVTSVAGASNGECSEPKRRKPPTKRPRDKPENWQTTIAQTLQDIQSHLYALSSNDDYHDTFGKYVASLLRAVPPQRALALQQRIVSLITSEAEEDPLNAAGLRLRPEDQNTEEIEIKLEITE